MQIAYNHCLDLSFRSAQTLQVIRDYGSLTQMGVHTLCYGLFSRKSEYEEVHAMLAERSWNGLHIIALPRTLPGSRAMAKLMFRRCLHQFASGSWLVSRSEPKLRESLKLQPKGFRVLHELHEEAFPYAIKGHESAEKDYIALLDQADAILFTTDSQRLWAQERYDWAPADYRVLPNSVDTERFSQVTGNPGCGILTYTGQLNAWKNVELLFAALALLPEHYRLRIAGGKGAQSAELIENWRRAHGIRQEQIEYLGPVPHQKIPDILQGSQALLLPMGNNLQSDYFTCPMKLIEYLATSIPVVAVDKPSVRSLIGKHPGTLLAPNDPAAFADAISETETRSAFDRARNRTLEYHAGHRAQQYVQWLATGERATCNAL